MSSIVSRAPRRAPHRLVLASAALAGLAPFAGVRAQTPSQAAATDATTGVTLDAVVVKAVRDKLDDARNGLSPDTGSSIYRFDAADIAKLPLGEATPLNQVLLRTPGVVQDSFGAIHVRGDHANLQYRIDGVVIPEAIGGFGQALDTRFANRIDVLTGALPAQYGYRTAGIVDIHTKGADATRSGEASIVFGSNGHREPSLEVGGASGPFQYFLTGSFLEDDLGIENPMPGKDAVHDETRQHKAFAYFSYLLGESSRASLMLGTALNRFQIPDLAGVAPRFPVAGATVPDSLALDANQRERTDFQVASLQSSAGSLAYQVSLFSRLSTLRYDPDPLGDLAYTGVAAQVARRNVARGLQFDSSLPLGDSHTLRLGAFAQHERAGVDTTSSVFPADAEGHPTSDLPLAIADRGRLSGKLFGVYAQDEWQVSKTLVLNAGLRFDHVDTLSSESQLSPRLGLVDDLTETTRLHAGYARYFTPPPTEKIDTTSVAEFQGTTNALPSDADTRVRAERSNYYDVGISQELGSRVTVGADAWYRQVRHLQDEGQFGNALIYSAFNFDRGRSYGLDLTASYQGDRLSAYLNVGLESARGRGVETGQFNFADDELAFIDSHWVHLDHEQMLSASTGASYRLGDHDSAGLDLLYGSGLRRGFANTGRLPAYASVNGSLSHSLEVGAFGRIELRLSAINLFDRRYELRDGSGIGVGAPQWAPRRSWFLTLAKPFGS